MTPFEYSQRSISLEILGMKRWEAEKLQQRATAAAAPCKRLISSFGTLNSLQVVPTRAIVTAVHSLLPVPRSETWSPLTLEGGKVVSGA